MNTARLFTGAWRVAPVLPGVLVRAGCQMAAILSHVLRLPPVRQLEANLQRVRPDLTGRRLRAVSRAGMRSYLRYFGEVLTLRAATREQITHRVRTIDADHARKHLERGQSVVAALGHAGNWDLAGAWSGMHLERVLTVAEILEPASLFEEFLKFRADLGMDVLALRKDGSVLATLAQRARSRTYLVPLLADRDLSRSSVEVDVGAHRMRVAAGPAVLAEELQAPLLQIFIRHERLHGRGRRRAGSPWGIVVEFAPITCDPALSGRERVVALTQAWVDVLMDRVRAYPDQWHMLQKVFDDDLDAARLARSHARAEAAAATEPDAGPVPPGATPPSRQEPGR